MLRYFENICHSSFTVYVMIDAVDRWCCW